MRRPFGYMKPLPPVEAILAAYDFDRQIGVFFYKGTRKPVPPRQGGRGYISISIGGTFHEPRGSYPASRLAWKIYKGADPVGVIDHINGMRDDNREENLRDVPVSINAVNLHGDLWERITAEREAKRMAKRAEMRRDSARNRVRVACASLSLPG